MLTNSLVLLSLKFTNTGTKWAYLPLVRYNGFPPHVHLITHEHIFRILADTPILSFGCFCLWGNSSAAAAAVIAASACVTTAAAVVPLLLWSSGLHCRKPFTHFLIPFVYHIHTQSEGGYRSPAPGDPVHGHVSNWITCVSPHLFGNFRLPGMHPHCLLFLFSVSSPSPGYTSTENKKKANKRLQKAEHSCDSGFPFPSVRIHMSHARFPLRSSPRLSHDSMHYALKSPAISSHLCQMSIPHS
jgi:hypothetical protein